MRLPWVSRDRYEEMTAALSSALAELRSERKILLDRLATLGLGGPMFSIPPAVAEEPAEEPELAQDPEQAMIDELMQLRHRPQKLADKVARGMRKRRFDRRPTTAWIPQADINAQLDAAEEQGRKQAIS